MPFPAIIAAAPAAIGFAGQVGNVVGKIGDFLGGGDDEPNGCSGYRSGAYDVESVRRAIADPVKRQRIAALMGQLWPTWSQYRGRVQQGDTSMATWLHGIASGTTGAGCSGEDRQMDALLSQIARSSSAGGSSTPGAGAILSTTVASLPGWAIPVAIGALVLVVVLILTRK